MKLREVVRAISSFMYEVYEYDVFSTGKISKRLIKLKVDETNIRCLEHNSHHEKLVGDVWFILSKSSFETELSKFKQTKVIVRKSSGVQEVKLKVKTPLENLIVLTDHAKLRLKERFGISQTGIKPFLKEVLKDHFIVQNYHFYNNHYNNGEASSIVVCSKDFKKILVLAPDKGKYVLITIYSPNDQVYSNFSSWFQDHLDIIHQLPTLQEFI